MPATLRQPILQLSWAQTFTLCMGLLYASVLLQLLPSGAPWSKALPWLAALLVLAKESLEAPQNWGRARSTYLQRPGWRQVPAALWAAVPTEIQGWLRCLPVWFSGSPQAARVIQPPPMPAGELTPIAFRSKTAHGQLHVLWAVCSLGDTLLVLLALHMLRLSPTHQWAAHAAMATLHGLVFWWIAQDRRAHARACIALGPQALHVHLGIRGWATVPDEALGEVTHARHGTLRPDRWSRHDVCLSLWGAPNVCVELKGCGAEVFRLGSRREEVRRLWLRVDDPKALADRLTARRPAILEPGPSVPGDRGARHE